MALSELEHTNEQGVTVRGYLHQSVGAPNAFLVLTHGAGSNANAPVLVSLAAAFAEQGITVLRIDLPFRQARPKGPPSPSSAAKDQQGLRAAAEYVRKLGAGKLMLGGQSYGGRQATLLAASDVSVCDGLLLLSYPLHPPGRADKLRTSHFPKLTMPALFVQGTSDPFGSVAEMESALTLLHGPYSHLIIEGVGHDLRKSRKARGEEPSLEQSVVRSFLKFFDLGQS